MYTYIRIYTGYNKIIEPLKYFEKYFLNRKKKMRNQCLKEKKMLVDTEIEDITASLLGGIWGTTIKFLNGKMVLLHSAENAYSL